MRVAADSETLNESLAERPPDAPGAPGRRSRSNVVWAMALAIAALLGVAVLKLAATRWYPPLDLAMTELHVRDVASLHPPLVGLIGRIGGPGRQGSHLGPASFYALWPFYQLFGASSWALEAATACLHTLAIAAALWIGFRRFGLALAAGVMAVSLALMVCLGPALLTQAWNPYLPVFWFLVFMLAAWSVCCRDYALLPVVGFAASFCVQTHISYVVAVSAVLVLVVVELGLSARHADPSTRKEIRRWCLIAAGVVFVLWIPPVYQEITGAQGNISLVVSYFASPPAATIGIHTGLDLMLAHLNAWTLFTRRALLTASGTTAPGLVLIGLWVASILVAWRLRARALLHLDAVLAVALLAGVWSMSRIFGFVWYYLLLWAWVLCALMVVTTAWAAILAFARLPRASGARLTRVGAAALVAVVVVVLGTRFVNDARRVQVSTTDAQNTVAGQLVRSTLASIRSGAAPGGGVRGRYLVTFTDPINLGSQAFTLVDELERAGIEIGMTADNHAQIGSQRVFDPRTVTGVVHVAVGSDILAWRAKPGAVDVVSVNTRTALQGLAYAHLRSFAIRQLTDDGLQRLVPRIDQDVYRLMTDNDLPAGIQTTLDEMIQLGEPVAVFIGPPAYARAT